MATTKQPTSSKPQLPPDPVAAAEQTIAALERDRAALVEAVTQDNIEMRKNAYAARVLHELTAVRSLAEIGERAREHDQRVKEIDCAITKAARAIMAERKRREAA